MSGIKQTDWRDRLIPWYFVAFFTVIIGVNIVLVRLAVGTFSGQISAHPYEEGLVYNSVIEAQARQEALGWKSDVSYHGRMLHFTLYDSNGHKLLWQEAKATLRRPTRQGLDFMQPLQPGGTAITLPKPGLWEVQIDAIHHGTHYQTIQRFIGE